MAYRVTEDERIERSGLWSVIEAKLESIGVDLEELCTGDDLARVRNGAKMVCVAPDMGESVRELGRSPRQHVVMVRVDEDTLRKLDAWVETGAVKSRSEAAALFIREGLEVRGDELRELADALKQVERAREVLRRKAKSLLGDGTDEDS